MKIRILISAVISSLAMAACIHDSGGKTPVGSVKADAGRDTSISVGDWVELRGRVEPGSDSIWKWEWDIGNQGWFVPALDGDAVFRAGDEPGSFENVLKVTGKHGKVSLDTMRITVVSGRPLADAGNDTTVTISDYVALHSPGAVGSGSIAKLEWDIGNTGRFASVPQDTLIQVGNRYGFHYSVLRLEDGDGNITLDTLRVTIVNDIPQIHIRKSEYPAAKGGGAYLEAVATDLGKMVAWQWDCGEGYAPGKRDTLVQTRRGDGDSIRCRVEVTDDDGNSGSDSITFLISDWGVYDSTDIFFGEDAPPHPIVAKNYSAAAWNGRMFAAGFAQTGVVYPGNSNVYYPGLRMFATSYDPAANAWTEETPLPFPIVGNSLVEFNGRILSVGGLELGHTANEGLVYEYMHEFKAWYRHKNMPMGLRAGAAAVSGDVIHYFGFGAIGDGLAFGTVPHPLKIIDVYTFVPETDTWTEKKGIPLPQRGDFPDANWRIHQALFVAGKIHLIATAENKDPLSPKGGMRAVWILKYDPATGSLQESQVLDEWFDEVGAAAIGEDIYVLGGTGIMRYSRGEDVPADPKKAYLYNVVTRTWKKVSSPAGAHMHPAPVTLGGGIYDVSDENTLEVYRP